MSGTTGIEWTDATWNPIRGCSRVSEGCRNCYAEKVAYRFSGPGQPYEGLVRIQAPPGIEGFLVERAFGKRLPHWNGEIRFVEEHLLDPLKWKKPRRIFVNSMSDLFHENVTDEMLDRIFITMLLANWHTFQVLTKRPERMLQYLGSDRTRERWLVAAEAELGHHECGCTLHTEQQPGGPGVLLPNVWLGVSVENQAAADTRIPLLLQTPAAVRFLSVEPLLGPVQLTALPGLNDISRDVLAGKMFDDAYEVEYGGKLDWVIVGGESGPGARPMHPDWARSLRDQCVAAGVPFFFKQWGEWAPRSSRGYPVPVNWVPWPDGDYRFNAGKKAAGRMLDGREWNEFPGEVRA